MANTKKASGAAAEKAAKAEKALPKASAKAAAKSAAKAAEKPAVKAKETADNTALEAAGAAAGAVEILKLKELVDRVASATSVKKPEAKAMVEAVLAQIGTAVFAGAELNLPHLGRLKTVKSVEKGEATQLTVKIKRAGVKSSENNSK